MAEVSAEVRERKTGIQQELERLNQELGTLKQQAEQERDKLQRHQTFLQLLYTLEGKLQFPEAELPWHSDLGEAKPQQRTQPQEQNTGDTMGRDGGVSSKLNEKWDRWAGR
ncbi:ZW10 interacting kinetochore protein [Phyllostomus discolor]|nr:ZW10 interacting kinetochore protein [Phyllostomus discolor]